MKPYQPQKNIFSGSYSIPYHDMRELLNLEMEKYRKDPTNTEQKGVLVEICRIVIVENRFAVSMDRSSTGPKNHPREQKPYCDHTIGLVANYCLELDRVDLVKDAVRAVQKHVPLETISDLASQFRKHNFSDLREW